MSYTVEYTSFSGKTVPVTHKIFKTAESAEQFGQTGVNKGNYRDYTVVEQDTDEILAKMSYHERMNARHVAFANQAHQAGDTELRDRHKEAAKEHRRAQLDYEMQSPRADKRAMDADAMSKGLLEAAPKLKDDSIKAQRKRDREHADAMGRHVKSGRKKTYTSTQRQMAKMRGEELPEGYKVLPPMDRDRYQERPGLEGPFRTLSGKVVYYDPKEGSYYDPDTDMYLSYDEFQALDNDYSGMKDERDIAVKEEDDERDELTKKLFPKMSPDEMKKRDQERNRAMNQQRFMKPGKPSRSREWGAYESASKSTNRTYARVLYDYREDYYNITVYKNGKEVESDDGYFGANETGNPLIKKFVDIVTSAGMDPEGLAIQDDEGKPGVFKNNTFNWNSAATEEVDNRDELTKKLFPKMSPDEMKKRDQERNRAMNQQRFMKPGKPSRSREWGAYESATNVSEAMRLDRDNIILPSSGAEQFAKHYRAGMMGDHRDGGPTDKDNTNSEKFYKLYSAKDVRSGFAGSGTTEYTNNKTGETFRVNRTPSGKGFYGTDHNIEVVSSVNESVTGMKKNIIAKIKSGATRADIKKQFPQLQKDDIDGFFKNHSTIREAELDEVSDKMLDRYRQKAFVDQPSGDDGSDKYRKRKAGRDLAFDKQTGRAKVRATKEEVELDEVSQALGHKVAKTRHDQASALRQKAVDEPDMTKAFAHTKSANTAEKKAGQSYNRLIRKTDEEVELNESFKVGDKVTYQKSKRERGNAVISSISAAKKNHFYLKTEKEGTIMVPGGELELVEDTGLSEGKIIATGVLRDKPFRKTFKNVEAMKKWADLEDADVRGYHAAPGKGEDTQESVNEDIAQDANIMERDHEVQMARSDLYKTANYAIKLHNMLKGVSEEQGIEGWMQAKITKAADYISSVYHSMEYDMVEKSQSEPIEPMAETTTAGGIAAVAKPMGKLVKRKT